jgi:phospholipid/cholesterol/gamma-HCH transport system permease protein
MTSSIQKIGRWGINLCYRLGQSGHMMLRVVSCRPKPAQGLRMLGEQIYQVGVLSLIIIMMSALFIGMVVSLQGYNTLQRFGAEQQLGQLIALSVVRELGPVVTALLFAGRAGSALAAEIGLMRATDQLSAMEMMAVNPLWRIIAPRFWAGVICVPLLTLLFDALAIFGGYLVGVKWLGVDSGSFWSNMQQGVGFSHDVINGVIKSLVFGVLISWVAVYQGYYAAPNAAGMGRATTRTVVYASLLILGFDFILTSFMIGG